jgi:hypothetical protein
MDSFSFWPGDDSLVFGQERENHQTQPGRAETKWVQEITRQERPDSEDCLPFWKTEDSGRRAEPL